PTRTSVFGRAPKAVSCTANSQNLTQIGCRTHLALLALPDARNRKRRLSAGAGGKVSTPCWHRERYQSDRFTAQARRSLSGARRERQENAAPIPRPETTP